ncbi:NAD(P)-dependent alcohol dehydrogenase [Kutzneria buriramensis]|uniref:NADPH:quinone reductase-like Zn-dependent oxidoreductase n=1 Tax=Kutzneria buriramensis TaxID=1045776 RepID=A0A3E0HGG9_9PSEU|nr:NAD(P)-dependent alcohol dehydrogenase [Kutzneria buriramensis]REH44801.1 NADPH:quinone reductase-like Zn-dependent oxidoreductase [Kutzneria buriramensis]
MKAIVRDGYGPLDVLRFDDVERPAPGPGQVLVRVRAAGVDPSIWHLTSGEPYLIRLMGYGLRRPKRPVPGLDLAGVIEEIGPGVTEFRPGDEVFGTANGSFAEYAVTAATRVVPKPSNLTFEQAAAVPVSACTALQGLRTVHPGQRALVIGAGGGVGTYAVQLAKALGAHVTGLCSTAKTELVRSLGADDVVDYKREPLTGRYDVILDTAGDRPLSQLRQHLTPKGTLIIVGGEGGGRFVGGVARTLRAALLSPFVGQQLRGLFATARAEDLRELRRLIEDGAVTPAVDRTFPLSDAVAAIRHVRSGQARGKVVVTP